MRLPAILFAIISLTFGAGIAWFVAMKTITWVETSQMAELEQSMHAGGIDWIDAQADGFVVTLEGEAPNEQHMERADLIASMIIGDDLINNITVAKPVEIAKELTQPMVEIMRNGADISLIGRLPIGPGRAVLDSGISGLSGTTKLVDISEAFRDEIPQGWASALRFGTQILSQTERAIITITPGQVVVSAVAGSANWQDGLEELLENMRPPDVSLLINIAAPRQVISPYRFALDLAAPELAICTAQNEPEDQKIMAMIKALTAPDFACTIGIGAPSNDWGRVVLYSLETLYSQGGGSLRIEDSDIFLVAPLDVDILGFAEAIDLLSAKLPQEYSLHSVVPPPPATAAEIAAIIPAEFQAQLSPEGIVTMSGALKDNLTRDVVVRYGESKFGFGLVETDFSSQINLPDGWQKRVFASIDALSLLESGGVEMTPDILTITGIASFADPETELSKLLDSALGNGAEFALSLSYEPRNTEADNMLDPRICAARVTTILDENQISFAPSSAVIEESSKPTIEAITSILTNCRYADFEIGGHTDSQGREEMNRSLSQARADAVLDAMLAQNLLLGRVTAVGYGEAEPIADNETEQGRAANRRIVIEMLRKSDAEHEEETIDE